jgi:uncharacterized protein YerC
MTHISGKKVDQKLMDSLFKKLIVLIEKSDRKSTSLVVNELFTQTEKVMFAKRLAVILMLSSKIPQEKIYETLKMSPTTIAKVSLAIENGKYKNILSIVGHEKVDVEKIIFNILTLGGLVPPIAGKKRWRKIMKK